jgi:hypothetical protein
MSRSKTLVLRTLNLLAIGVAACTAVGKAATNTGLDLTQPLTSIGYGYQSTYFTSGVLGDARSLDASFALRNNQFTIYFPYSQDLHLTALGTGSNGKGDVAFQYNYVLPQVSRFRQTFGAQSVFPSDGTFSSNERLIAPLYQMSYQAGDRTSLLFLAKYAIGYNSVSGSPRYNELTLSPYTIFDLSRGSYAAIIPEYHRYAGDLHYASYDAKLDVGRVVAGHYNVSAFYGLPLNAFSYNNLYRSTYGMKLSLQL